MPRGKRTIEAEVTHKLPDLEIPAAGAIPDADSVIERVSDMSTVSAKAAELKFMEEPVEIVISDDHTGTEPQVFCAVNGEGALLVKPNNGAAFRTPWLPRGVPVTIRRKFVERLARARKIGIRTEEVRDGNGDRTTVVRRNSALPYTFQVMSDPNPEGLPWLRRVMAEA